MKKRLKPASHSSSPIRTKTDRTRPHQIAWRRWMQKVNFFFQKWHSWIMMSLSEIMITHLTNTTITFIMIELSYYKELRVTTQVGNSFWFMGPIFVVSDAAQSTCIGNWFGTQLPRSLKSTYVCNYIYSNMGIFTCCTITRWIWSLIEEKSFEN